MNSAETDGGDTPPTVPPPEPTEPPPPPPADLPTVEWFAARTPRGAALAFDGPAQNPAIDVRVLAPVLVAFDRLVRIIRVHRSGLDVKRTGRLTEVKGAPRLKATPAFAGSYILPMRLEPPEDELVVIDHGELEDAVGLLALDTDLLLERLLEFPERVGDELDDLLKTTAGAGVDLRAVAFKDGRISADAEVRANAAQSRIAALEELARSEPGEEQLEGRLFRIDTKRMKIAVDVPGEDDDDAPVVVEAHFNIDRLEELRRALGHWVELELTVWALRRRYERSARSRIREVTSVRRLPDLDDDAEA